MTLGTVALFHPICICQVDLYFLCKVVTDFCQYVKIYRTFSDEIMPPSSSDCRLLIPQVNGNLLSLHIFFFSF